MSSGVRNLRAMFEQNAASSPEPRGRSPGSSSAADDSSRPTSKVRASFVSVEHPLPHPTDFGAPKAAPSNSTAANRRESFSISEDTAGEVAELKKVLSEEREERRKSVAVIEPIPEQAVASRESSVGPPPVKNEPEGEMVNLGTIMKGSDFPEPSADTAAGAPHVKEEPAPELPAVKEEPVKEDEAAPAPVQETPADNPDKATSGAQEEVSLKPADPTDASAVAGGKALPSPAEELKAAVTEPVPSTPAAPAEAPAPAEPTEPTVETPKPTASAAKLNGTPATKGKLETKKPTAISTKAPTSKTAPVKSPLPKTAPRTPTVPKQAASTSAPKVSTPSSKPVAAAKPAAKPISKEPPKPAAPKPKTSHTSLRQSTATAPTAAAKAKTTVTENKKLVATKPKEPTATSPPAVKKPKPKPRSPTRPVALNSRLTAPTAASAAKLHAEEAKVTRKPSTATRPSTKPATTKSSRLSVAPSASTTKRPESRTSTVGAKPGFLERMSRPTAASASKVHDKPTSPPQKAPVKSSVLQKSKKKVEDVAAKAKAAVTSNDQTEEPAKTEAANGTGAHTEASDEPAADPVTQPTPEPTAEKVDQAAPVNAETPVPEGESSAVELQTSNFQGEAVR